MHGKESRKNVTLTRCKLMRRYFHIVTFFLIECHAKNSKYF